MCLKISMYTIPKILYILFFTAIVYFLKISCFFRLSLLLSFVLFVASLIVIIIIVIVINNKIIVVVCVMRARVRSHFVLTLCCHFIDTITQSIHAFPYIRRMACMITIIFAYTESVLFCV